MKRASRQFMAMVRLMVGLGIRDIKITGIEHLQKIGSSGGIVIATTHMTDLDMPLSAFVLGRYFDLVAVNMSLHHSFRSNPLINILLHLSGKRNFLPVDYKEGKPAKGIFNLANYIPMMDALHNGKAVMISAHRPMSEPHLPERGGIGVVYLAGIANAPILPVAVRLQTPDLSLGYTNTIWKTILHRPSAHLIIGSPLSFDSLSVPTELTPDLKQELGRRSKEVMIRLAGILGNI
ncbi:MAG TPA: hypothetical protein VEK36_02265 [Candidatus Paceibacterota bacterium]|nr:hypothetical protein [Candidatus Paceibacterota bacterium]